MTAVDSKQINEEACAWIAKLHGAQPSAEELEAFRQWKAQSPAHKAEITQLAKLWGELNVLTELAVVEEPITSKSITSKPLPLRIFSFSANRSAYIGVAACVSLIGVMMFTWFMTQEMKPDQAVLNGGLPEHATVVGEQRTIILEDGSSILLNTNSRVRVAYTAEARNVYLNQGQAHFDVASNSAKPFNVYAGQGMVRAIGTAFSVYLKEALLEVTVTEGSVELNAVESEKTVARPLLEPVPNAATIKKLAVVNAGQNAKFDQVIKSIKSIETVDTPEILRKLAWREGLLKFAGAPLYEVIEEVSRYTSMSIVILDPEIRELRIGGFFKVGETDKMFEALESSFGIRVERLNDNLVHLAAVNTDARD